jgi:hypothetical protein
VRRHKLVKLEMKKGILQQIPMKFRRSLENILKFILQNTLEYLEIDKFLNTYDLQKLNQEDINNLNISSNSVWSKKILGPDD